MQKPKIVGCKWEHSFGELLVQAQHTLSCETVSKIQIVRSDHFRDSQEVSIDSPVYICQQFNCKFVCYELKEDEGLCDCVLRAHSLPVGSGLVLFGYHGNE